MGGFGVLYIEMWRVVGCVLWLSGVGVGVLFVCVVCYCVVWVIAGVACLLVIMVWCVIAVCLCLTLLLSRYCLFVVAKLLVMLDFGLGGVVLRFVYMSKSTICVVLWICLICVLRCCCCCLCLCVIAWVLVGYCWVYLVGCAWAVATLWVWCLASLLCLVGWLLLGVLSLLSLLIVLFLSVVFICVLVVIRSVLGLFVGCLLCCFGCWAVMILMAMFMLNL